ncbi:MAG: methyltransferase domain-containing protein [Planctomycetes bacterium]|nr:methyltransferase domain-containing protein [Planctomycetota bacterium]
MSGIARRLWLNVRMAGHALRGRWLGPAQVGSSYDAIAAHYDESWQRHLRGVTDALLERLPETLPRGSIVDLGCGTGYATSWLASRHPDRSLIAVDVSAAMLARAQERVTAHVDWRRADMLEVLRTLPGRSVALVASAWAIGYSRPVALIHAAARALGPGGILAFVVNRLDTLPGVFGAFVATMREHPGAVRLALWPRFPRSAARTAGWLRAAGFTAVHVDAGAVPIRPPDDGRPLADWLETTGVLAGFDGVLPLREPGPVRDTFRAHLCARTEPLEHRYVMAIAAAPHRVGG